MNVDNLKPKIAIQLLKTIVAKLDSLDEDDYFGSEGWKHFFGVED